MNDIELKKFLDLIDSRIKKYINDSKLLRQYPAVVSGNGGSVNPSHLCNVYLLGYPDTLFTFTNQTIDTLHDGDRVYVLVSGNDLNTGIISYVIYNNLQNNSQNNS